MTAAEPTLNLAPVAGTSAPSRIVRFTPSRGAVICLLIFMGIVTTEGFSRWLLSKAGLEPLLYVRELFPLAGMILAATMKDLPRRTFVFVIIVLQLLFAAAIGFRHWGSVPQVIFGVKVFMPLLFAVAVYPAIIRDWDFFRRGCLILLGVVVFGVVANKFVTYPWIGSDFTVGNVTVETSREWAEIDGRDRLPGFSRASYDAASHILFLTIIVLAGTRRAVQRIAITAISGYAVFLTTSKAPLACLLQIILNYAVLEGFDRLRQPRPDSYARKVKLFALFALRLQILVFILATVILPLNNSGMLDFLERDLREDSTFHLLSMQDRAARFWPIALEHISHYGSPYFGTGAGGVGTPLQTFGNSDFPITCDNAFIYAYGVFGLFFVPYYLLFIGLIFTRRLASEDSSAIFGLIALSISIQALTTNTFEGIYDCLFVGIIIAHMTYGWRLRNSPLGPQPSDPNASLFLRAGQGAALLRGPAGR